jgi:gamma-glutamyltranspeptidase / glutathione hydrolase
MRHDFHWSTGYASNRSPVFARNIVATSHPLAGGAATPSTRQSPRRR